MRVDQGKADEVVFSDFGYESEERVAEYIGAFNGFAPNLGAI